MRVVGGVSFHRHTSRVHLTGVLGSRHLAEKHENVSIGIHRGTRWNGWGVFSQDNHQNIMTNESELPWSDTSE